MSDDACADAAKLAEANMDLARRALAQKAARRTHPMTDVDKLAQELAETIAREDEWHRRYVSSKRDYEALTARLAEAERERDEAQAEASKQAEMIVRLLKGGDVTSTRLIEAERMAEFWEGDSAKLRASRDALAEQLAVAQRERDEALANSRDLTTLAAELRHERNNLLNKCEILTDRLAKLSHKTTEVPANPSP